MKRTFSFVLSMLAVVTVMAGCSQQSLDPSPHSESDVNQLEGVTMVAEQPNGTTGVDVVITNETDEEHYYGVEFAIEKWQDDKWQVYPFAEDMSWIEIAIILAPGSENTETIDFSLLENEPEAGKYRVIKTVSGLVLAAEFNIIETE